MTLVKLIKAVISERHWWRFGPSLWFNLFNPKSTWITHLRIALMDRTYGSHTETTSDSGVPKATCTLVKLQFETRPDTRHSSGPWERRGLCHKCQVCRGSLQNCVCLKFTHSHRPPFHLSCLSERPLNEVNNLLPFNVRQRAYTNAALKGNSAVRGTRWTPLTGHRSAWKVQVEINTRLYWDSRPTVPLK